MKHFFEKRDPWGNGMAMWVLLAMIFAAPPAWWSLKQIELENDVANWLPSTDRESRVLHWYHDLFPTEDRIIATWKDSSLDDPRVREFAARLEGTLDKDGIRRNGLRCVDGVLTPHEVLERMTNRRVERDEAVRRLQGYLIGKGKLKVRLTSTGRELKQYTINSIAQWAKTELNVQLDVDEPTLELVDETEGYAEEEESFPDDSLAEGPWLKSRRYDLQLGWKGMGARPDQVEAIRRLALNLKTPSRDQQTDNENLIAECFFEPGSPIALSISLSETGRADERAAFREIRRVASEVGIDQNAFMLGGRIVVGSLLNQEVKKVAWNRAFPISQIHRRSPLLLSAVLSILLAFVMLRSVRLAGLVLVVTFYSTLLTVSLVPVTGGSMNMVLVVMPTLLMVLTLSAGIHVANYWKHAAYNDMRTAVVEAMKMAKQPCALASFTTAIGLASLAVSPLAPVRDFGIYAAIGCLVSLVMVLFGLPAMLMFWPARRPDQAEVDRTGWKSLGTILCRYRTPVTLVCLVAFGVGAYGLKWFRTEIKVIRYFPEHARVVQDYHFLEDNLAGIIPVDTVVRFSSKAQRNLNFSQRLEVVREIQEKLREHPEISGALSLADFEPFNEPPTKDAGFLQKARYNKRANVMEDRIKQDGDNRVASFLTTPKDASDFHQAGDELWRITAQASIMSNADYADLTNELNEIVKSVLKYHVGADHVVTGMVPLFLRTQQAVLESLIRSFALAFAVIAFVMVVLLKNPLSGLITMLPNLMPVGIVFGLISWYGLAVDIGTMITASVALGIAVDGTLHLLTWFRAGISEGLTRHESVSKALGHCGPAMWQTSAAVGLGLLMLFPTELLLVSRFGWLMAAMIAAAFVADIILLPALLAGPLGYLIERTDTRSDPTVQVIAPLEPPQPHLQTMESRSSRVIRLD